MRAPSIGCLEAPVGTLDLQNVRVQLFHYLRHASNARSTIFILFTSDDLNGILFCFIVFNVCLSVGPIIPKMLKAKSVLGYSRKLFCKLAVSHNAVLI